jgi:hypothetical protein
MLQTRIDDLDAIKITLAVLLFNSGLLSAHDAPAFDVDLACCNVGRNSDACLGARQPCANCIARDL